MFFPLCEPESMNPRRRTCVRWIVIGLLSVLLTIYVSSYVILSRRGFAQSDSWEMEGFYFLPPENTDEWRSWNYALVRFYYPLILVDNWVGTGRPIASEPLWGLS
jgi:hypothetical protein